MCFIISWNIKKVVNLTTKMVIRELVKNFVLIFSLSWSRIENLTRCKVSRRGWVFILWRCLQLKGILDVFRCEV